MEWGSRVAQLRVSMQSQDFAHVLSRGDVQSFTIDPFPAFVFHRDPSGGKG